MLILNLIGLSFICVGLGVILSWCFPKSVTSTDIDIDLIRKVARNKGEVLHIPSYEMGVEAYCDPKWQYDNFNFMHKDIMDRILTRI